jgi:hypothetical protein
MPASSSGDLSVIAGGTGHFVVNSVTDLSGTVNFMFDSYLGDATLYARPNPGGGGNRYDYLRYDAVRDGIHLSGHLGGALGTQPADALSGFAPSLIWDATGVNTTGTLSENGNRVYSAANPPPGGSGVTSVTGTANQITASPTSGSVVLTLPSAITTPGTLDTTGNLSENGNRVYTSITAIPESQVTNLVSDLAAKATDTLVVHLAGTETITGAKTFSLPITVSSGTSSFTALNVTGTLSEGGNHVYSAGNPPPYPVTSVATRTGAVTLTAADIGAGTFPAGTFALTSGNFNLPNGSLVQFVMSAGNTGYLVAATNTLKMRVGTSGLQVRNNADSADILTLSNAGALTAYTLATGGFAADQYGNASGGRWTGADTLTVNGTFAVNVQAIIKGAASQSANLTEWQDSGGSLLAKVTSAGLIYEGANRVYTSITAIPESQVTNLVSDLAAKATDSLVVHLAGTETITGAKTFTAVLTRSAMDPNILLTDGTRSGTLALASNNGSYHGSALQGDVVLRGDAAGNTQGVMLAAGPSSTGYVRVDNAGTTVSGALYVTSSATIAGSVALARGSGAVGYIGVNNGGAGNTGYIDFVQPNGNRAGYIGYGPNGYGNDVGYINYTAGTHSFTGAMSVSSEMNAAGTGFIRNYYSGFAAFGHVSAPNPNGYALLQDSGGQTYLNSASGQPLRFRRDNANVGQWDIYGNFRVDNAGATVVLDGYPSALTVLGSNNDLGNVSNLIGSRGWYDRIRFTVPNTIEIASSISSPSWTTTGAPTAATIGALLAGQTNATYGFIATKPALRLTWNQQGGWDWAMIRRFFLGWSYDGGTGALVRVIIESSSNGTVWTTRADRSGVSANTTWVDVPMADHGGDGWLRLSLLVTLTGAPNTAALNSIQALSGRSGDSGGGEQRELPYTWDYLKNISMGGGLTAGYGLSVTGTTTFNSLISATAGMTVNGLLTAQGTAPGSGDVLLFGNDLYAVDINVANRISFQGGSSRAIGEIQLGSSGPIIGGTGSTVTVTGALTASGIGTFNGAPIGNGVTNGFYYDTNIALRGAEHYFQSGSGTGNVGYGRWTSAGLRIGDQSTPTAALDVVGAAKISSTLTGSNQIISQFAAGTTTASTPMLKAVSTSNATGATAGMEYSTGSGWATRFGTVQNTWWHAGMDSAGAVHWGYDGTTFRTTSAATGGLVVNTGGVWDGANRVYSAGNHPTAAAVDAGFFPSYIGVNISTASSAGGTIPSLIFSSPITDNFLLHSVAVHHYGLTGYTYNDGNGVAGTNLALSGYFGLSFATGGIERLRIQKDGTTRFYGDGGNGGMHIGLLDTTAAQATPKKYLRSQGGQFQVINDAYNAILLSVTDSGVTTSTSTLVAANGFTVSAGAVSVLASSQDYVSSGTLGGTTGNSLLVRQHRTSNQTNNWQESVWMYRRTTGTDWTTAQWFNGISIDGSFVTPTTSKSYWRRDPQQDFQAFGSNGTDVLTITTTGASVTGTFNSTSTLMEAGNRVFSPGNLPTAAQVTAGTFPAGTFVMNSTFNVAGGTLIVPTSTSPAQTTEGQVIWNSTNDLLTVGTGAGRKTMVDLDSTQTLTNKTLTTPVISSISNSGTLTLPTATDTLVGRTTTDTLTNKTLTSPAINSGVLDNASTLGGVTGTAIAADHAAWTNYNPTPFTNVTGGAATAYYLQMGKTLFIRGTFSAGTATAAAVIQVSLPAGMTAKNAGGGQAIMAQNNNAAVGSNIASNGTTIRIAKDMAFGNWAASDSIANVHWNGVIELA